MSKLIKYSIVPLAALTLFLSACLEGQGNKQVLGSLIGAGLGGLAGSQIGSGTGQLAAVGAGVLLGGLLGSEVGRSLDKADQAYAARTYHLALATAPSGQTLTWVNPDSGNRGSYTPLRTFQIDTGQYCREFQQTVVIGGRAESAYGTACRREDGAWEIVQR